MATLTSRLVALNSIHCSEPSQAEDVIFRVDKQFLSPSAISNTVAGSANDRSSERTPMLISQITQEDFEDLLRVFHDECVTLHEIGVPELTSV